MSSIEIPDKGLLQDWLDAAGFEHYLCGQCEGLHVRALQEAQGVIDCRLFMEDYGLLLTTELELRPAAVLQVCADLGRLNMDYPTLKVFLDLVDEALPQLVIASNFHSIAGISAEQFDHFVTSTIEATGHLADSCLQLGYIYTAEEPSRPLLH